MGEHWQLANTLPEGLVNNRGCSIITWYPALALGPCNASAG
jgi:hypothetical protein